jgi:hypothetical protein
MAKEHETEGKHAAWARTTSAQEQKAPTSDPVAANQKLKTESTRTEPKSRGAEICGSGNWNLGCEPAVGLKISMWENETGAVTLRQNARTEISCLKRNPGRGPPTGKKSLKQKTNWLSGKWKKSTKETQMGGGEQKPTGEQKLNPHAHIKHGGETRELGFQKQRWWTGIGTPLITKMRQETRGSSDPKNTKRSKSHHMKQKQLPLKTELIYSKSKRSLPSLSHFILRTWNSDLGSKILI